MRALFIIIFYLCIQCQCLHAQQNITFLSADIARNEIKSYATIAEGETSMMSYHRMIVNSFQRKRMVLDSCRQLNKDFPDSDTVYFLEIGFLQVGEILGFVKAGDQIFYYETSNYIPYLKLFEKGLPRFMESYDDLVTEEFDSLGNILNSLLEGGGFVMTTRNIKEDEGEDIQTYFFGEGQFGATTSY